MDSRLTPARLVHGSPPAMHYTHLNQPGSSLPSTPKHCQLQPQITNLVEEAMHI
jgi:hypothetical protein